MSKVGILKKIKEKSPVSFEMRADKCGVCLRSKDGTITVIYDDGIFIAVSGRVIHSGHDVHEAIKFLDKFPK